MDIEVLAIERDELGGLLPFPDPVANKYSRGKLTVVGGSTMYPGAVCLAACAAERMGAGYVEVFCSEDAAPIARCASSSLVVHPWDTLDVASSSLHKSSPDRPQACLVGPGFSGGSDLAADPASAAAYDIELHLLADLMQACTHPVLVDGGAIGRLANEKGMALATDRIGLGDLVITPHLGEAKRLSRATGIPIPQEAYDPVKIDRISDDACISLAAWAHRIALAYHATVVLKGPDTFVARCDSSLVRMMGFGGPALSKAGTGDILAGMISSLLAQGSDPGDACVLASSLHALSASLASDALTEICVCPQDIICFLPEMIGSLI